MLTELSNYTIYKVVYLGILVRDIWKTIIVESPFRKLIHFINPFVTELSMKNCRALIYLTNIIFNYDSMKNVMYSNIKNKSHKNNGIKRKMMTYYHTTFRSLT